MPILETFCFNSSSLSLSTEISFFKVESGSLLNRTPLLLDQLNKYGTILLKVLESEKYSEWLGACSRFQLKI